MNFRFTVSDVGEKGEFIFEGKQWSEKTGQFFRVFKCTVASVYAAFGSGFRL